jgi:hypothetical protein
MGLVALPKKSSAKKNTMRPPLENFFFSDSDRPPLLPDARTQPLDARTQPLSVCATPGPLPDGVYCSQQCEPSPPRYNMVDSALLCAILAIQ